MSGPTYRLSVAGVLFMPVALAACSSDTVTPPPAAELNVVETVAAAGSFGTLLAAVEAAGLTATLEGPGPFTVFAPTDAAFAALPAGTVEGLLADPEALSEILLYHVVPGRILASDLEDGQVVTTAEGREFRISLAGGAQVNGVNITTTDVEASNGVIHVIDGVLIPVSDIVDTAIGAGFTTLVAAVGAADLEGVLRSAGPFTVFAPTDEAFDALPAGTLDAVLADQDLLTAVLTYHVVPGRLFAADLEDGMELTTAEGRTVVVSLAGGARVNDAGIVAADILTSNGVIHVIDAVLVPQDDD